MRRYQELSNRGQVDRLRPIGRSMSAQFGWADATMRLVNHGFNTTFALRRGRERAALRINVNSLRSEGQLRGELAWVNALAQSPIWVPRPYVLSNGNGFLATHDSADLHLREPIEDPIYAVLYSWLPGRTAGHQWGPEVACALGVATRQLHDHGRSWIPPDDADFRVPEDVMIGCPLNPRAARPSFLQVIEQGNQVVERLRSGQRVIPIHYDLHMWNIKWTGGRLAVFDFDDCRMGWPAWDVAITLFYMRRFPNPVECEEAYWAGLESSIQDLGVTEEELEILIASRGVFLASEMLSEWTADIIKIGIPYLEVTEKRVQHFLATGRFDPNVAVLPS